jgi:hypothetical protein
MSYPLLTKSLPTTLRQNLRQPTWIATIASVGIHGVLWIVLPFLPIAASKPEEPDIPRSVSLLELTPQEESRLPDISMPDFAPPNATSDPNFLSLNPVPNPFPPIPDQPNPFSTIPSRPPSFYSFPPYVPPTQNRTRTIPTNPSPSTTPSPSPTSSATASPSPRLSPGVGQSSGLDQLVIGRSPSSNPSNAPERSPEELREDLIARQNEMRQLLTYNSEGRDNDAGNARSTNWFQIIQEKGIWQPEGDSSDLNNLDPAPQRKELQVDFPELACQLRNFDRAEVWVGLVVTPEGEAVEAPDFTNPELLKPSEYPVFDQKAMEIVTALEIDVDEELAQYDKNIPYWIRVLFQRQDGCRPLGAEESAG